MTTGHVEELNAIARQNDLNLTILSGIVGTLGRLLGEVMDIVDKHPMPELGPMAVGRQVLVDANKLQLQVLQDHEQALARLRSVAGDVQSEIHERN